MDQAAPALAACTVAVVSAHMSRKLPKSTSMGENAAGSSGYAPPVQEERRVASDGNSYTFQQFLDYYGEECGTSLWNAAQDTRHMAANLPKSTSDDSHLAGDSKQSENKHFAGMAAEVTGGHQRRCTSCW